MFCLPISMWLECSISAAWIQSTSAILNTACLLWDNNSSWTLKQLNESLIGGKHDGWSFDA